MVPLNISRPLSFRKAVAGRMPMANTTTSAGRLPASVATLSALPVPLTPWKAVPVKHPHPLGLELPLDVTGHLGIKDVGHELGKPYPPPSTESPWANQVLGHFQADEAASHHHGAAGLVLLDPVPHGDGIVGGAHPEDARQRGARHIGHEGLGAHRQDQLVVALGLLGAGGPHPAASRSCPRHPGRWPSCPVWTSTRVSPAYFWGVLTIRSSGWECCRPHSRQAAARVGDVRALAVEHHLGVGLLPFELCRRLGAGGYAADDDDFSLPIPPFPGSRSFSLRPRFLCFCVSFPLYEHSRPFTRDLRLRLPKILPLARPVFRGMMETNAGSSGPELLEYTKEVRPMKLGILGAGAIARRDV